MNTIQFTKGDAATVTLFAEDETGAPLDLTGATFSTSFCAKTTVATFGNSKHTIIDAAKGHYTLDLSSFDTAALESGAGQDVISTVTQSGKPTTYRGLGVLEVFSLPSAQATAPQTNIFLGSAL